MWKYRGCKSEIRSSMRDWAGRHHLQGTEDAAVLPSPPGPSPRKHGMCGRVEHRIPSKAPENTTGPVE